MGVEGRRKAVHIGMAAFALLLPSVGWRGGAAAALLALAFNLFVLPRAGGAALSRAEDAGHHVPVGIALYPVAVLLLILLFRHHLELAAAGWGLLAFGDGFATLAGKAAGGRGPLPWNERKSWAGSAAYVVCGAAGAALLFRFVSGQALSLAAAGAIVLAALFGAFLESLPSEIDDNLLPPIGGAAVLALFLGVLPNAGRLGEPAWIRGAVIAVALNTVLPLLALRLRVVRPSGAIAGGIYGAVILSFGGPKAYGLLWAFFAIGTFATRLGRKRKEALGKAEEAGGRRGAANVVANLTVPALLIVAGGLAEAGDPAGLAAFASACRIAAAASLATALMDTVGTEVGQAVQGRTVLLPDLRAVVPGTDGGVSLAGTAAGLLGAGLVGALLVALFDAPWSAAGIVVAAACAGTVVESLLGREGAPWKVTSGHVLNVYNTGAGAAVAWALSSWSR